MKGKLFFAAIFLAAAVYASACSQGDGSISTADYIGIEAAKEAALKSADISADQAVFTAAALDSRNGISFYQVNFTADGAEYEYAVDALTGIVIQEIRLAEGAADVYASGESGSDRKGESNPSGQQEEEGASGQAGGANPFGQPGGNSSDQPDGKHASGQPGGDNPSSQPDVGSSFGQSNGNPASGQQGGTNAAGSSGRNHPSSQPGKGSSSPQPGGNSTPNRTEQPSAPATAPPSSVVQNMVAPGTAEATALAHAGVSRSSAKQLETSQDSDDGTIFYKVKFYGSDGTKYKYKIDASTGAIRDFSSDSPDDDDDDDDDNRNDDDYHDGDDNEKDAGSQGNSGSQSLIGEAAARQAVAARVPGAAAGAVSLSLDEDDGRMEYEGELIYDGMKYEFKIDAYSGALVEWEAEPED